MANNRIYLYHPATKRAVAVAKCLGTEWYSTNDVANRIDTVCEQAYHAEPVTEDTTWELRYEHHDDPAKSLPDDAILHLPFEGAKMPDDTTEPERLLREFCESHDIKAHQPYRRHELVVFSWNGQITFSLPMEIGDPKAMYWKITLERIEQPSARKDGTA